MLIIIFIILSALYDKGKRFEDHTKRFMFRIIIITLISILQIPTIVVGIWKPTLMQFVFNTALFYFLFDYTLNLMENRKWNYIGNTSKIDLLWHKYGGWMSQLIFKIIFLTTIIYLK